MKIEIDKQILKLLKLDQVKERDEKMESNIINFLILNGIEATHGGESEEFDETLSLLKLKYVAIFLKDISNIFNGSLDD
jgi:hypothetical protein|nr:MAG TPA: hypothetical protein [Caudoviricetes sp.]